MREWIILKQKTNDIYTYCALKGAAIEQHVSAREGGGGGGISLQPASNISVNGTREE